MTVVKRVSSVAVAVLAFSALCHGAALAQWRLAFFDLLPLDPYGISLAALVTASVLLSGLMFVVAERYVFRILLAAKVALLVFATYPYASRLSLSFVLLFATIAEICVYEGYPANLYLSVAAAAAILLSIVAALWETISLAMALDLGIYLLSTAALTFGASLLTRYRQEMIRSRSEAAKLDRVIANLADANKSFLRIAHAAEERSTRDERNRITRELHDTIGYTLTNLIMTVQAAKALASANSSGLQQTLDSACDQARRGLEETRRSLRLLREQEVVEPQGLSVVQRLVTTYEQATGVHVDVEYTNMPSSCREEINSFVYQFVQEGLTNSFRHGKATRVRLHFWKDTESIRMNLWDNGVGAAKIEQGIGLLGMREQLGKLGGTLEARNVADGFQLSVEIPVRD